MGLFGGNSSSSSSQTLSNSINYTPIFTFGDDNENDMTSDFEQRASASATALAKDEMTASVGVGLGGSGSGGSVKKSGNDELPKNNMDIFSNTALKGINKNYILLAGAGVLAGTGYYFATKKK